MLNVNLNRLMLYVSFTKRPFDVKLKSYYNSFNEYEVYIIKFVYVA